MHVPNPLFSLHREHGSPPAASRQQQRTNVGGGTMKIKSRVRSGGINLSNHNQTGRIKIKSGIKAGGSVLPNHNQTGRIRIKSGVKAGALNHNQN
jgi:hypothetical protein